MKIVNLLVIVLTLAFWSCEQAHQQGALVGSWSSVVWRDVSAGTTRDTPVKFIFEATDRYEATYGSQVEKGKYWISGEHLHTVEDGKAEKKVKIAKLENDTLIFEMNRAGSLEELVLVKK